MPLTSNRREEFNLQKVPQRTMASPVEIQQSTLGLNTLDEMEKKDDTIVHPTQRDEPSPSSSVGKPIRWNQPRIHIWRTLATFLGLFIMGMNDGAYGVCSLPAFFRSQVNRLIGFDTLRLSPASSLTQYNWLTCISCSLRLIMISATQ